MYMHCPLKYAIQWEHRILRLHYTSLLYCMSLLNNTSILILRANDLGGCILLSYSRGTLVTEALLLCSQSGSFFITHNFKLVVFFSDITLDTCACVFACMCAHTRFLCCSKFAVTIQSVLRIVMLLFICCLWMVSGFSWWHECIVTVPPILCIEIYWLGPVSVPFFRGFDWPHAMHPTYIIPSTYAT